jgi:hypothetical protein
MEMERIKSAHNDARAYKIETEDADEEKDVPLSTKFVNFFLPTFKAKDRSDDELSAAHLLHELRMMLIRKDAYGLPGTDGSYLSNLWALLKEEHLLLGVMFANKESDFSPVARGIWLFNALAWQLFVMSWFIKTDGTYAFWESIVVSCITLPYKAIIRYFAERPFVESWYNSPDADGDKSINCKKYIAQFIGHIGTTFFTILSVFYIGAAMAKEVVEEDKQQDRYNSRNDRYKKDPSNNRDPDDDDQDPTDRMAVFLQYYAYSVCMSFCVFSPALWIVMAFLKRYHDRKYFEDSWAHLFSKDEPVYCISQVAQISIKRNLLKTDTTIMTKGSEYSRFYHSFKIDEGIKPFYLDRKKGNEEQELTTI